MMTLNKTKSNNYYDIKEDNKCELNYKYVLIVYKYFSKEAINYAYLIAKYLIDNKIIKHLFVEDINPFVNLINTHNNICEITIFNKNNNNNNNNDVNLIDLVITIGGDGTILWANNFFSKYKKPLFLTFNLGTLGYLAYYNCNIYDKVLYELFLNPNKVISYESRSTLDVEFVSSSSSSNNDNNNKVLNCLNEIVLSKLIGNSLISTKIYINDCLLTNVRSDGVLISTATGSTAYNLSSGGSIVHYNSDVLILNAICPFSLSFRPIIFTKGTEIKFILDCKTTDYAQVCNDGINSHKIKSNEGIKIKLSDYNLNIIILDNINSNLMSNWMNKLVNQLGWNNGFKNNNNNNNNNN